MATQFEDPAARDEEARHVDEVARAHAALAKAQDRLYWLDRLGLDIEGLMERRGGGKLFEWLRRARSTVRDLRGALRERAPLRSLRAGGDPMDPAAPRISVYGRGVSPRRLRSSIATDLVFDRLTAEDLSAIEAAVDPGERLTLDTVDPVERRRVLLNFGVFHEVPGVLERSGLTEVAGGSLYHADLVADAFAAGGLEAAGTTVLEVGGAPALAVRALGAAFPDAAFTHSAEPPAGADGSLDAAYAFAALGHLDAAGVAAWFEELRRLVKPGGLLVAAAHGPQSLVHARGTRGRTEEQLAQISAVLDRDGFWFEDGAAFMTAEWLLDAVTPQWKVVAFAPGRVEDDQDLYVLERR